MIEPWNIGDVVLSTVILAELRSRYPRARISLLAKPYATELLKESPLVDEIIPFDLPWTAQRNKYPLGLRTVREMTSLVRKLRAARFDVTIDSRMDIRLAGSLRTHCRARGATLIKSTIGSRFSICCRANRLIRRSGVVRPSW